VTEKKPTDVIFQLVLHFKITNVISQSKVTHKWTDCVCMGLYCYHKLHIYHGCRSHSCIEAVW